MLRDEGEIDSLGERSTLRISVFSPLVSIINSLSLAESKSSFVADESDDDEWPESTFVVGEAAESVP